MRQHKITDFYELGLLYGDTLTFLNDNNIKVKVVSRNKVSYKGKALSLSAVTNIILLGENDPSSSIRYNGWDHWLFNGYLINDRRVLLKKHIAIQKMQKINNSIDNDTE